MLCGYYEDKYKIFSIMSLSKHLLHLCLLTPPQINLNPCTLLLLKCQLSNLNSEFTFLLLLYSNPFSNDTKIFIFLYRSIRLFIDFFQQKQSLKSPVTRSSEWAINHILLSKFTVIWNDSCMETYPTMLKECKSCPYDLYIPNTEDKHVSVSSEVDSSCIAIYFSSILMTTVER